MRVRVTTVICPLSQPEFSPALLAPFLRLLGVGDLKYDTTTDGRMDHTGISQVMVAFKDNQAMPEYLVRFKWTN